MKQTRKPTLIIVCAVVIISIIVVFFVKASNKSSIEVKVVKAGLHDIKKVVSSSGSIEAEVRVRISSKIKEKLAHFKFKELDHVNKGDVIAKLDDTAIAARLNQAKAALVQAETNLANATIILNRVKNLYAKDVGSKQNLDDAQMSYDMKSAQVIQQDANVHAIQADLDDTTILSPISGTIIRKYVEEGEMVGLLTVGMSPIVELAKLDFFEVHTDVDETDIGKILVGMKAEIMVDAFPDAVLEGEVKEIALSSLEKKETGINYVVEVKINNAKGMALRLGMTADVNFILESKKDVLSVPLWSVIEQDDKECVFMVNEKKLYKQIVETGIKSDDFAEILSGLDVGQTIVKSSMGEMKEGLRVIVID